ncbi:hypothetical protein BGZ51_000443 [Haplosporangium sp. Z 767]|nr:hypothetical protein BGZ51_000443 [Haplosporangium sp. Z 767]KAF9196719.1 hypothetical protein BGZ50_007883 [Haplosporangium sp. Z 11]
MANKAPKPPKAPKAPKQPKNKLFSDTAIYKKTESLMKETKDAKPFEDMSYVIAIILGFFIWRLYVSVTGGHAATADVWSLFVYGSVFILNLWTFFLVMILARTRGDVGVLQIAESDVFRFTALSGLFGAWMAILFSRYRPKDSAFLPKLLAASVLNVFWVVVYIRNYL